MLTLTLVWVLLEIGEETRPVFVVLIGLLSLEDDNRLKYELDSGDILVPVELGGVRCLLKPSSVYK